MDDCSACEEKSGRKARRKRMEIRRFKHIASTTSGLVLDSSSSSSSSSCSSNKRLKNTSTTTTAAHAQCHMAPDSASAFQKNSGSLQSAAGGFPSGFPAGDAGFVGVQEFEEISMASPDGVDGCPPHGAVSVCGRRREMEDAVTVMPAFLRAGDGSGGSYVYHLFGVFDGHGGSQAALYCRDRVGQALAEEVGSVDPGTEAGWRRAMSTCFLKMDRAVDGLCCVNKCKQVNQSSECVEQKATGTVGSTAVVAVVGPGQIIVANCGDSRAVLSTAGKAIPLSTDHKPDRADEMARIEAAGGRVIYWNGYRVLGVLAMSRAIGDRYLKPYVVAEPELTFTQRTDEDECLIVASDGLWDVISNEVACEIARKCLGSGRRSRDPEIDSPAAAAAALLTKLALARGSPDNISVVVVDLKNPTI